MPHVVPELTLDGRELPATIKIDWVRADMSLETHHTARVRMVSTRGAERGADRSDRLDQVFGALGKTGKLELTPEDGTVLTFEGIVSEIAHERALDGDHALLLTISSTTLLLDGGARSRVFEEMSAKDIANTVVSDFSEVRADLGDLPSSAIPFEAQSEETDLDFLRRLAGRASVWLYHDGQGLKATQTLPESAGAVTLSITRSDTAGRLTRLSVESRMRPGRFAESGFLQDGKEEISADESAGRSVTASHDFVRAAKRASDPFQARAHPPALGELDSQRDLDEYSKARVRAWLGNLVHATGTTTHPGIRPGLKVTVEGAGGGEDGDYLVTRAVHDLARHTGYSCELEMIPVAAAYPQVHRQPAVHGLRRAKVVGEYDGSDHAGMVRVQYADTVDYASQDSVWARVAVPHGGEEHGFIALPEIDDEVVVAFDGGRATHPVVVGSVYSSKGSKKSAVFEEIQQEIEDNEGKAFLTKSGNLLLFKDKGGEETIEIRLAGSDANFLRMTMDGPKVELETEGDILFKAQKTVTIQSQQDMTFDSKGKLTLKSAQDLVLDSKANLEAKATVNMDLSAVSIGAKATNELKLEGVQVKASGSAMTEVAGGKTSLKGTGMVEVQAPLVKIN